MRHSWLLKFKIKVSLSNITLTKATVQDAEPTHCYKIVLSVNSDLFFDLFTMEN